MGRWSTMKKDQMNGDAMSESQSVPNSQEASMAGTGEQEVLTLSEDARVAFAEFMLNPHEPNRRSMAAAARYKAQINQGQA